MGSITKYATTVEIPKSSTSNHYKQWKDKSNLLGTGYSTCYSRSSPLAGKNGTYNTPAPVILTNFGFNVPQTADIQKVIIHYKQRKEQLSSPIGQTAYPAVNAPKITLLNSGGLYATGSTVPINYTTYTREFSGTAEFTNVTPAMINSGLFGVRFDYPKNANTNPGVVWLGDVHIEIVFNDNNVLLGINNFNRDIIVDTEFTLEFACQYLGNDSAILKLPLSFGTVSYLGKKSGTGVIIEENGVYYWNIGFTGKSTANIVLRFKSSTTGNKTLSMAYNSIEAVCNITVVNPFVSSVTNGIKDIKRIVKDDRVIYQVIITNAGSQTRTDSIRITFPEHTEITNLEELSQDYRATTSVLDGTLYLNLQASWRGTLNIPIIAVFQDTGYYTQEVYYDNGLKYISTDFTVYQNQIGELAFEYIQLPDSITDGMAHNVNYILACFTRWVTGEDQVTIADYGDNLRIGVFNAHESFTLNNNDFLNHVTWSNSLPGTEFKETNVTFKYNSNNPVYIVYSHSHVLETNYHYVGLEYSEPILIEKSYYSKIKNNKTILRPTRNILTGGDYCSGIINPSEESAPLLIYDPILGGLNEITNGLVNDDSEMLIQGIEFEITYISNQSVKLETELYLPGKVASTRNMTVKGSGTLLLGRKYDTWGLKMSELQNNLDLLGFYLVVANNENNPATIQLNDVKLHIYYIPRPDVGQYGFTVDGERSKDYGVYLNEVELPFGTKFEKEEYHINGTDETTIVRTNIDSKEIKMTIGIDDCDEEDIIYLVDKLETLLTNQRDLQSNKPIPKSIEFDIMPSWKYQFVRVKEFDGELTKGSYEAKITLLVPSGTRDSVNKTLTGSSGTTGSFIPIKPLIYCKSHTNGLFSLKEIKNNFILSIKNSNIESGDTVIVDNQERQVKVIKQGATSPLVLNEGISLETTWFIMQGEFNFTSETSNVYQVEYYEKR